MLSAKRKIVAIDQGCFLRLSVHWITAPHGSGVLGFLQRRRKFPGASEFLPGLNAEGYL
ncbi:hypothetical protein A8926_7314 [Saccharopolyspora spinosa]|uniref:Uncharacterized protein n=1 Tax=Saccharopolyspora spinosa TaxID=60894 RepID=A0A2N3Y8B3_SACSN|nr:hypothetical protein A8926_7314 [Saccharopolyspora spinosa]